MSTSKVWLTTIDNVRPHPNADSLDLAEVQGWQVVTRKGTYQSGDRICYFEQGLALPRALAEELEIVNYLSEKTDINGDKQLVVHRVKLRGEASFGVTLPAPYALKDFQLGSDVSKFYDATKFEPPIRATAGDVEADHPKFRAYTDIENLRTYPDIFQEGEEVVVTEKIHGTNARVGFVVENGICTFMAGSRRLRRKQPDDLDSMIDGYHRNTYWFPYTLPGVRSLMAELLGDEGNGPTAPDGTQAVLYGEVFGQGVQPYTYKQKGLAFRAFDLMVDGKYCDYKTYRAYMEKHGIPVAPSLYHGAYNLNFIKMMSEWPSAVGNDQGSEGVVVRPAVERDHPAVGRVVLKYVSDTYLFGKTAEKDTTDQ